MKFIITALVLLLAYPSPSAKAEGQTLTFTDGMTSPPATLEEAAWLAGLWRGEAFGGQVEENWSPPLGDSMAGAFKLVSDGKVDFYELEVIREVGNTLILQLKHFHGDLRGWEEKDETVDFPLVKVTETALYFDGFTIERVSSDAMNMYVRIKDGDVERDVLFAYRRVK
ncbi:DUF6265 family protein [Kordiimonas lacus]|uniref:DUF6265 domain-containing protein n=1 Tax=Kordiimonas lacus TaxID=637679 RepID=A0A1G7DJY5_9PROT|nr:DUF6265 family protein [Kordiimonas lacus]SDE51803.1 hypothetical protein SAMN04488071_3144 [Kordiimonas lacus]